MRILVPDAGPGDWYVLLYAESIASAGAYTVEADVAPVFLTGATPDHYGTSQDLPLTLTGAGFDASSRVELVGSDGTTYAAQSLALQSTTQLTATFTAGTVPARGNACTVLLSTTRSKPEAQVAGGASRSATT